jgi:hypothetical protein
MSRALRPAGIEFLRDEMATPQKRQRARDRKGAVARAESSKPARRTRGWLTPPGLHPVRWPADVLFLALIVGPLLSIYALTGARTVLLEDDGLFLMSAATLGISHPPGYPVHTLLAWLAIQAPLGTPAFRVHLLSGLLGALACGALGWIVLRRTGSRVAAVVAALSYGVSEHFWSQSVLAEVYTLNALFFFVILAICLEAAARPAPRLLVTAALLYGLSLANHWPLMVLATPAFLFTLACRGREVARRAPLLIAIVLISASMAYVWMVWRSNQNPPVSFYGPLQSWRDIFFYISRRGYAAVDVSPTAGWGDKVQFAGYVLRESVMALSPAGALLALIGLIRRWQERGRLALIGEIAAFCTSGLLLAFLLGFDYDFLRVAVFRPYPLIAYGLLAIWAGSGALWMIVLLRERSRTFVAIGVAALLSAPAWLAFRNWSVNDRSRDDFADRHARLLFELADRDTALLAYGDSDTGPLGYLHIVEGLRPDLTLYSLQGLVFSNRLMPALSSPARRQQRLRAFLEDQHRSVYHMTDRIVPTVRGEEHLGFLKRVVPDREAGIPVPVFRADAGRFFRDLLGMPTPTDRWVRMTRNQLLHQYGNFLGLARLSRDELLQRQVEPLVALAQGDYYATTGMVEMLTQYGQTRESWEQARERLEDAERMRDQSVDRERLGREHYLRGFLAFRLGDVTGAQRAFQRSLEVHPSPENASHLALRQLAGVRPPRR